MQALIIKQDGKVYYIAAYHIHSSEAIRKAISFAIMVKNQEYAKGLITERFFPESNKNEWTYNIGKPYEFPYLKVRIEQLLSDPPITVAIIEEEKGEDLSDEEIIKIYRDYVGAAETNEDRLQRIHNFRCKKF